MFKNKKNRFLILLVLIFSFMFTTNIILADGGTVIHGNSIELTNPLCPKSNTGKCVDDIPSFVKAMLEIVMKVGVPLVAIAIIYTGYLFIAAQGNEKKLEEAKQAIVWVFVGAVILLGAYVIAQALQGTVNAIRGV